MEIEEWKDDIIKKAKRQILYRNNMLGSDVDNLTVVLYDYLDEGILILKNWRKLKDNAEFLSGKHDAALVRFTIDKYLANGRELFDDYSSGGVKATMKKTPESVLKSSVKQVM